MAMVGVDVSSQEKDSSPCWWAWSEGQWPSGTKSAYTIWTVLLWLYHKNIINIDMGIIIVITAIIIITILSLMSSGIMNGFLMANQSLISVTAILLNNMKMSYSIIMWCQAAATSINHSVCSMEFSMHSASTHTYSKWCFAASLEMCSTDATVSQSRLKMIPQSSHWQIHL